MKGSNYTVPELILLLDTSQTFVVCTSTGAGTEEFDEITDIEW